MARNVSDNFVNSLIGDGTHFRGDVRAHGLLRVDGDITGTIRSAGKIVIGADGRADCTIHAAIVVVAGALRGTVYATEKVVVLSSAIVIANVYSPRLIAEEGVVLHGSFVISGAVQPSTGGAATRSARRSEELPDEPPHGRRFGLFGRRSKRPSSRPSRAAAPVSAGQHGES